MLCTPFLARCWTGFHPHFWWQPYPLFKTIQTLGHFSMFFLNHFGCFIPRGCLSPMPASLAGLLLLVTYLILAILYFFEGAGKDHSLAVLEWLAAFSSHVFHTTPRKDTSDQWTFFFFQKFISNICIYIYIYLLRAWFVEMVTATFWKPQNSSAEVQDSGSQEMKGTMFTWYPKANQYF